MPHDEWAHRYLHECICGGDPTLVHTQYIHIYRHRHTHTQVSAVPGSLTKKMTEIHDIPK